MVEHAVGHMLHIQGYLLYLLGRQHDRVKRIFAFVKFQFVCFNSQYAAVFYIFTFVYCVGFGKHICDV
ncbi:hypothetical protein Barb7_02126 [Bacteroidales bacterium Barb7]|nr:hypothetical protein Barb7_02126 [Bacteroidales bacterium Barb7]